MWVKRDVYESLLRDRARLESEVELSREQIASLRKEIDYWRGKFEREQERADRVNDRLMESSGFAPVSETGIKEADDMKKKMDELVKNYAKQTNEMFADEIPGEGGGDLVVDEGLLGAIVEGFKG